MIPNFNSTNEAYAFGLENYQNPDLMNELIIKRDMCQRVCRYHLYKDNMKHSIKWACRGQFFNEALYVMSGEVPINNLRHLGG